MSKKAGLKIGLRFMIGLVLAIIIMVFIFPLIDDFIIWGKDKESSQKNFFDKLNYEIENMEVNKKTSQIFELEKNRLIISFNNNQDSKVNLKDIEEYSGNRKNQEIIIKKSPQCTENCLCLCVTEDDNILFEDDCLQEGDLCIDQKKPITQNGPFFLFGKGVYDLKIEKRTDKTLVYMKENN